MRLKSPRELISERDPINNRSQPIRIWTNTTAWASGVVAYDVWAFPDFRDTTLRLSSPAVTLVRFRAIPAPNSAVDVFAVGVHPLDALIGGRARPHSGRARIIVKRAGS